MNRLHYIMVSACLLLQGGMAQAASEAVTVKQISLALDTAECKIISVRQPAVYLEMRPDCYMVRREKTQQIHIEAAAKDKYVILVVGSPVRNMPHYPITMTRRDCGSQLKAIIIEGDHISVSKNTLTEKLFCAGLGVEKEYYKLLSQH